MKETGMQIKKLHAEKTRRYLIKHDLLINNLRISRDKDYVYFPVKSITNNLRIYKTVKMEFEEIKKLPRSYKEMILIPEDFKSKLPTSYDIIGDIIIIKIPRELIKYKSMIGRALLKTNKSIKTVCHITSISGELRTRNTEVISGEKSTITFHKENGLRFYLDISKTYFSPRLASERKSIAHLVKSGEVVVDMFAGVAPFSIMIAKNANPKVIYAFDKNKDAIKFALNNIKLNKVIDKVEVIHADSKNVKNILDKKTSRVDRIIMNLPFSAHLYLPYALKLISDKCIIHYYTIIDKNKLDDRIIELEKIGHEKKILLSMHNIRKIKTYSPREFYIGIDITAKKKKPM
jgi:tRNA (guanine37-N1)-methyltransferase